MQQHTITRRKYSVTFIIIGVILLAIGIGLGIGSPILNLEKVIFDLPWLITGIGFIFGIYGVYQLIRSDSLGDVSITRKSLKAFLTNNAIILALLALVVVICIIEPRFMQIRVLLDILTMSSTKLIIALGICFTLLIAGTDLSAGRMVGLAAVVSCSMLQTADYGNRFYPDLPQVPLFIPIVLAIIACMLFGVLNGYLVAKFDMHPFIATLAVQVIIYGACSLYFDLPPNNSQPIGGIRPDFSALGQTKLFEKFSITAFRFCGNSFLLRYWMAAYHKNVFNSKPRFMISIYQETIGRSRSYIMITLNVKTRRFMKVS